MNFLHHIQKGDLITLMTALYSGIFAILGILIGARLSLRSELLRLQIERRTKIFDEACDLTARYYVQAYGAFRTDIDNEFMQFVISLDRKIWTAFSTDGYNAWKGVEKMIAHRPREGDFASTFTAAQAFALDSLAKELQRSARSARANESIGGSALRRYVSRLRKKKGGTVR